MKITAPDFVVLSAFRYALGRKTYIVRDTTIWLTENWYDISKETRDLIKKELGAAFATDNELRQIKVVSNLPLGMDMDRMEWAKVWLLCEEEL